MPGTTSTTRTCCTYMALNSILFRRRALFCACVCTPVQARLQRLTVLLLSHRRDAKVLKVLIQTNKFQSRPPPWGLNKTSSEQGKLYPCIKKDDQGKCCKSLPICTASWQIIPNNTMESRTVKHKYLYQSRTTWPWGDKWCFQEGTHTSYDICQNLEHTSIQTAQECRYSRWRSWYFHLLHHW